MANVITEAPTAPVRREGGEVVYAEYIRELVQIQETSKGSIEQRAVNVISTASTIAGLLFGFTALARGTGTIVLPELALDLLGAGIAALALSAVLAILVNRPLRYSGPKTAELKAMIDQAWDKGISTDFAGYQVAEVRLAVLQRAKEQNARKAKLLLWAIGIEGGAILALGVAAIATLVVR